MNEEEWGRFQQHYTPTPDGCWDWTASRGSHGYGQMSIRLCSGTWMPHLAHRLIYEHTVGTIPNDLQVDHLCGNKGCVRPDHLELVTQKVNIQRGFQRSGRSYDAKPHGTTMGWYNHGCRCEPCRALKKARR